MGETCTSGYPDDGGLYTLVVGTYPPNLNGLYDMAGNAAEWVSDTAMIYNSKKDEYIYKLTDIESLIQDLERKDSAQYEHLIDNLIHDRDIITSGDMRLVKGGSWADGLAYLQIGGREAMDKEKKSSRVGFRIAASYDEKYEKHFPKKYWKQTKKNLKPYR